MPLYEYQCDTCDHRFEVIQKFSDAPIETCPNCGGSVTKLFSSPAIQFKGSGFYITDYARSGKSEGRSESKTESNKTESGKAESGKAESGKAESAKTDTSESKTESKPIATPSKSD